MKKVRKFYDETGKSVREGSAVKCQEIELDDNGKVVRERHFRVGPENQDKFNSDKLKSRLLEVSDG